MNSLLICFLHMANPARAPWRLAVVIVIQFLENLTDRQAADAERSRLDVKYLQVMHSQCTLQLGIRHEFPTAMYSTGGVMKL